jgi:hypothetical protein
VPSQAFFLASLPLGDYILVCILQRRYPENLNRSWTVAEKRLNPIFIGKANQIPGYRMNDSEAVKFILYAIPGTRPRNPENVPP